MSQVAREQGKGLARIVAVGIAAFVLIFAAQPLQAQTFTTLWSFCSQNSSTASCTDGENSAAGLVQGSDGNFYGTTPYGGGNAFGTIFNITPSGTLTTLYSFCPQLQGGYCPDGEYPLARLVQGSDGNFYGTTSDGGANGNYAGTVFKITPSGTLTTLYTFCSQTGCTDGGDPYAGLVQGSDGNFYGTTESYGAHDAGTVFKITPSGTLTTLHTFCSLSGCADGGYPVAGLIQASDGNFYGTTSGGGANGVGTVFKITSSGTLTTLHSFCSQSGCTDGADPVAGLVQATDGNLYGTTREGGSSIYSRGVVYKITTSKALTTLHIFCSDGGSACTDGALPEAGLLQARDGNFYGTANWGGAVSLYYGSVFKITPSGTLTTLYSFCSQSGCTDGTNPQAGLVQGSNGDLYGTAYSGGADDDGTVFSLSLGEPGVSLSTTSLNFQNVPVGTQSTAQPVTVTNTGSANLILGTVMISGTNAADFTITSDTCSGQTIGSTAPTNTCSVSVAFTPSLNGGESASLNFPDNAASSPQSVALSGAGSVSVAALSPGSLTFSSQPMGTSSASQPATLSNTGTAPLSVASIATSSEFGETNNCGSSVAASSSCTINVTFTPNALGAQNGSLTVTDNSGGVSGSQQTTMLSGTGALAQVAVPNVVGDTEAAATAAITGAGLAVGSVTIESSTTVPAGEVISESPAAGALVNPGSAVSLWVSSGPPVSETIAVSDAVTVTPLISVTAPVVYYSAGAIGFGAQSGSQTLTVSDIGLAPLALDSTTITGSGSAQFTATLLTCSNLATSLPTTLPSGGACTFTITYTSSGNPANDTATLAFADNASLSNLTPTGSNGTQSIALSGSGTGTAPPPAPPATVTIPTVNETITVNDQVSIGPLVDLSPSSLTFAPQAVGNSSSLTVTLTNEGNVTLAISSIGIGGGFSQTNNCGTMVSGGSSCTITVTFEPLGTGTSTATLIILDNAPGSPQTVALSGTGVVFTSGPRPPVLPPRPPGPVPGQPIRVVPPSPIVIAPITVPVPAPPIHFASSATVSAPPPAVRLAPSSLTFSAQPAGATSKPQTVTLTNTGSSTLTLTGIATSANFSQTNNCGGSVAAGASCTINVTFSPTAAGSVAGTLTIIDNNHGVAGSTESVTLRRTGNEPVAR